MNRTSHGGEAIRLARELGLPLASILDCSASINPLGTPAAALAAAGQALADIGHYPEIDAASLLAALALHHDLPVANLVAANGSTELIYLLPRLLRAQRALIVTPAFSEYKQALLQVGRPVDTFELSAADHFRFDPEALLAALDEEVGLVIVANPGNPSASGLDRSALLLLADRLADRAALIVDEAFVDFAPQLSVLDAVAHRQNLYVLRSMTKFYAIPGLRVGYLAAPDRAIRLIRQALPPWTINTPALAAAIACLHDHAYQRTTLELIPQLRQQLAAGLTALGLTVFESVANYLLAQLPAAGVRAPFLAERLRGEGILIRDCSNFSALDDRYIRLAVRTAAENSRLLSALSRILTQER